MKITRHFMGTMAGETVYPAPGIYEPRQARTGLSFHKAWLRSRKRHRRWYFQHVSVDVTKHKYPTGTGRAGRQI